MTDITDLVEFYVSVDVESTGPIPGEYSMSSFGAFICGGRTADGRYVRFAHGDPLHRFYIELKPITDNFVVEAILVGLLEGFTGEDPTGERHLEWMKEHGTEPGAAMAAFAAFIATFQKLSGARPVFVGYPAGFDWMFLYWYLVRFGVESPFGFSGMLDLKSIYVAKAGVPMKKSTKRFMPKHLLKSDAPHTHHALDDAIGQGDLAMNLFEWAGPHSA